MSDTDPFEQFKETFFTECREYLDEIEQELSALTPESADDESLNSIFRGVHSIKGGAGTFGFDQLIAFTHQFESVLDALRSHELDLTDDIVDVLLASSDIQVALVDAAEEGSEVDPAQVDDVVAKLSALLSGDAPAATAETPAEEDAPAEQAEAAVPDEAAEEPSVDDEEEEVDGFVVVTADAEDLGDAAGDASGSGFRIGFRPNPDMFRRANEPLLILRELEGLGEVSATADTSRVPTLEELDPEGAYLAWVIDLESDADREAVDEVFEFVADDCILEIDVLGGDTPADAETEANTAPAESADAPASAIDDPEPDEFGFVPVKATADAEDDAEQGPAEAIAPEAVASAEAEDTAASEPTPIEAVSPEPAQPATAPKEPQKPAAKPAAKAGSADKKGAMSIRVDLGKVDRLVNMVGELVISQAMLAQQVTGVSKDAAAGIAEGLDDLGLTVRDIQESVMSIRAQPVQSVFARMSRIVRDTARDVGKKINMETVGEDTEVDKTIIEHLTDPLTHMIRNAIDHGVESPEDRVAAGKDATGTITLSAGHRGGRVVIEVIDDGAGINRERVLGKAIEKGLVQPEDNLTDEEIDNLVFAPGFSTAEAVSNLSGRGVGMDVVRRNIQDLGGRVSISSEPGQGSRITMTLPLTLAVMDGMIVRVGSETFIVPLTNMIESIKPEADEIHPLVNGVSVLAKRGVYTPLVAVHELFAIPEAAIDPVEGLIVMVENESGDQAGLVVDEIIGQQQVVLKSLETNYEAVGGVSAATILGDGRVALILDVAGLCDIARTHGGEVARELARRNSEILEEAV